MKIRTQEKKKVNKEITIMIMNDTGKKPFQIRIPTVLIKAVCSFVLLLAIVAGVLYGRNVILDRQVANTAADNMDLNAKVDVLESNQEIISRENSVLKETVDVQESQVRELKDLAEEATQKLNELYQKEESIYQKIDDVMGETSSDRSTLEEMMTVAIHADEINVFRNAKTENIMGVSIASANLDGLALMPPLQNAKTGMFHNQTATATRQRLTDLIQRMEKQSADYDSYGADLDSVEFSRRLRAERMMNLRQSVVDYAKQFLGGRYIYGGSNPNIGADCSGFTRYILGNKAGVWLNRTAAAQSQQGRRVSIDEAMPGDLIFYAGSGGGINHVAMYIGNGKVIHSSNERNGVMISVWNYRTPVVIRNMIGN